MIRKWKNRRAWRRFEREVLHEFKREIDCMFRMSEGLLEITRKMEILNKRVPLRIIPEGKRIRLPMYYGSDK